MNVVFFVMAITLNIFSGDELSRTVQAGPFKTELECEQAQFPTGFQKPDGAGRIVVYNCVALSGGPST